MQNRSAYFLSNSIHKFAFLVDKLSDRLLQDRFRISTTQYRILLAIKEAQTSCCQKDVARYWHTTQAAVCRQIEILKRKNLIACTPNPKNRRQHVLSLTSAGSRTLEASSKVLENKLKKIYRAVGTHEQDTINRSLLKLLSAVSSAS